MILSLCSALACFAQGNGMAGISEATNMVTSYFDPLTKLIFAVAAILGHYIGAGLAIKNGSKIVKPTVILVLLLLTVKVGSELLFPEFWN